MEQKTEASQAVDERPLFEQTMNDLRFFPRELDFTMTKSPSGRDEYANAHLESCWNGWQARAALKAQPAPTEAAQGGPIHTINGTFDSPLAYIDYLHNELATLAAQGEDSARLSIPVSAYLWLMGAGGDAFAQPLQAGAFWWRDTFNKLAGVDMMEVIKQDRARASAETGGVKP